MTRDCKLCAFWMGTILSFSQYDMNQSRSFMFIKPLKGLQSARYTYLLTEEDRIKEFVKDSKVNATCFSMI